MHTLILLCISQYKKFTVPSFAISKDIIGQNLKLGHVTNHAPFRGG